MDEDKEIEKEPEEEADQIKMRDFSEVWEKIKDRLETVDEPQGHEKSKKWKPIVGSFVTIFVLSAVIVPVAIYNNREKERVYLGEKLGAVSVNSEEFYAEIEKEKINVVNFSDFSIESYFLLNTESGVAKGGIVDLCGDTLFATVKFYDAVVVIEESSYESYDLTYADNNIEIRYKLKEYVQDSGYESYTYSIFTKYNRVTYIIEYTSVFDDVTEFFKVFFD